MPHKDQQFTPPNIRNLQLAAGDPGAFLTLGRQQASNIAQQTPDVAEFGNQFSQALRDLMIKHSRPYYESRETTIGLQQEQARRGYEPLPTEIARLELSPRQLEEYRGARQQELTPTISEREAREKTYLGQFEKISDFLFETNKEIQRAKEKARDNARLSLNTIINEKRPDALESLLQTQPESIKLAGYDSKTILGIIQGQKLEIEEKRKQQEFENFLKLQTFERQQAQQVTSEQKAVQGLAQNYPDAGISLTDTLAQAQAKLSKSRIYQQKTRLTSGGISGIIPTGEVETIDNWVQLLSTGQISLSQVPQKIRNQIVNRAAELGTQIISPTFAGKSKEAISAFNSATALLDTVENASKKVITAELPTQIPKQYLKGLKFVRKFNPDIAIYQDTVNAFLSMLTRASGEKGVLTTQDVDRIKNALPQLTDTRPIAEKKLQSLRSLFEGIRTGTVSAFTPSIQPKVSGNIIRQGQTHGGIKFKIIK